MPLYDYRCTVCGAVREALRRFDDRDNGLTCPCDGHMARIPSVPHCLPDGVYSYAPNLGSEAAFARRLDAVRNGERVIQKTES